MEQLIFEMPAWQVYTCIGLLLCIAEIFVPGFILLPIGIGFLLTIPFTFLTDSISWQFLILAILEMVVFIILKKIQPQAAKPVVLSNAEGMIGKECHVIKEVTANTPGYVKLYGDEWQALTESTHFFAIGEKAIITRLDGNKVYIDLK